MTYRDTLDNDDKAQPDLIAGEVGDVETAGETTAADTITGPPDARPVGADTSIKVADTMDSGREAGTTTEDLVRRQGENSSDEPES